MGVVKRERVGVVKGENECGQGGGWAWTRGEGGRCHKEERLAVVKWEKWTWSRRE